MSRPALDLLDDDRAATVARAALELPGADGVEVFVVASNTGVTRYAGSEIISSIERREMRAQVRVVVDGASASAATNQLDETSVRRAAERALEGARASRPDRHWPGLASPEEAGEAKALWRWDEATAEATPAARAERVGRVLALTGPGAAGVHETSSHAYGVFTSTGLRRFDAHTRALLTCLVDREGRTGWGEGGSWALKDVDVEEAAGRAIDKAGAGAAVPAEPGAYEVVLEPPAVAEMLDYLAYVGFGAKQVLEGESFLATRANETVAAPEVTIADDPAHPASIGIAFDFEGVAKRRVAVIEEGVARGPVTDRRTAGSLGLPVTGHSSGSNEYGPLAANVVMSAGAQSLDELVSGVEDGLLVTRFHYVNVLDRPSTLLTGMTRDGTFRIRRGELAEPVHNLRFTQSVLDALAATRGVGREIHSFAPDWGSFGSTAVPALRIGTFRFTSATSH